MNLNKMGAKSLQKQWLDWKWRQSIAPNGAQIGLGTDVGSLAICYRTRPVQEGRPADRPDRCLGALADLGEVHRRRQALPAASRRRALFIDSGSNVFNAIIGQLEPGLLRPHGKSSSAQPEGEDGLERSR